jgi:glycosyltransferase involved in cell wall biosynthesis
MEYLKKFNKKVSEEFKYNKKIELNLPTDRPIVGFVGSYCVRKGIDILLEACSKLRNINFHIVLLGDGDIQWVKSLIDKFNLDDKVSMYPFQDPVKFYSIFDIFVLPSRKEGFGLVSIEAMMMGVPTIRSNVEGASDQIENGINGYIFENENPIELSKYISLLVQNKKLRKDIGGKGTIIAINKFSEDIMMDKLIQVYKEAIRMGSKNQKVKPEKKYS